ncbi:MAG: hypothetical protein JJ855_11475 [Rhodospirillales bacterium]|nr:hypothetical protein [Rhodospirillales bacterium]
MFDITQDQLETLIDFKSPIHIIDVRKKPAVEKEPAMIQGAVWQDFQDVSAWTSTVKDGRPVVCYCVHGHEVSQSAMKNLRERGVDAYYLRGGFESWQTRSGPLKL